MVWFLLANAAAFGARLGVTTGQWIDQQFLGGRRPQHPLAYRSWQEAATDVAGLGFLGAVRAPIAGLKAVPLLRGLALAGTFEFAFGRLAGVRGVPFVIPELLFPRTTRAFMDMANAVMGIGVATLAALGATTIPGLETAWRGIQQAAGEVLGFARFIKEEVLDPAILFGGDLYAAVVAGFAWLSQWFGPPEAFRGLRPRPPSPLERPAFPEIPGDRPETFQERLRRLREAAPIEEAVEEVLGTPPVPPGQSLGDSILFADRSFRASRIAVPESALILQAIKASRGAPR